MSEQLEVLKTVAQRLSQAGIPYMVSGSVAMNFYAQPRMTRDIDIVVHLTPTAARRLPSLFSSDFYVDSDDVAEAVRDEGMFNIIHNTSIVKVDFIVRKENLYRKTEFDRRMTVPIDGTSISIVSPEDLLLSKLCWARDGDSGMQLKDARNIVPMKDTSLKVERVLRALFMAKSDEERLTMGCSMFDDAKAIVLAGLRAERPDMDDVERRVQLFMRLHGQDLGERRSKHVSARLRLIH